MSSDPTRYACGECTRTDLALTAKDLIRSHTANGRRKSEDNPSCPGSGMVPASEHSDVATAGDTSWDDSYARVDATAPGFSPDPADSVPDPEDIEDPSTAAAAGAVVHTLSPRPPCPGCGHAEHSGECRELVMPGPPGDVDECGCLDDRTDKAPCAGDCSEYPSCPQCHACCGCSCVGTAVRKLVAVDAQTGQPFDAAALLTQVADDRCEWSGVGRHVWRFGECVCEAKQPGYVPPSEAVAASVTAAGGDSGAFLMGAAGPPQTGADAFDAIDALMADDPPADGTDKLYKNGRYALPDPVTGKPRTWTRATTMAETTSDLYSLNLWRIRMMIIGLVRHPELLEGLAELDAFDPQSGTGNLSPKEHKDILNKIGFRAQSLAGSKVPARWGTEMHLNIERLSRDEITVNEVPEKYQPEVTAWAAAMSEADLSAVPHLIERRIAVPLYGVAGTLDQIDRNHRSRSIRIGKRIIRINAGDHLLGDVKSGKDLDYAWGEISIQMALYAHGAREGLVAMWDPDAEDGEGAWVWEDIGIPAKSIRQDVGVVMHVPVGQKQCTLHWIDLEEGWRAAQLCDSVRDWRKAKGLHAPFSIAEVPTGESGARPTVRDLSWSERFASITTRDQASEVYREYISAGGRASSPEAKRLVALAKRHLAQLEESTA